MPSVGSALGPTRTQWQAVVSWEEPSGPRSARGQVAELPGSSMMKAFKTLLSPLCNW